MKYSLRQLEIFLAIARHQNISKAAEALHMSQSAASNALQTLEANYGLSLFERQGKRLQTNETGNSLRRKAEALLAHAQEFELDLNGHAQVGHLRVGASYTIGNHLAVGILASYLSRHSDAKVQFQVANSPEIVAKVLNYEVDIGMIEGEIRNSELELIPWREDELVVFCSPEHPLAKLGRINEKTLLAYPWILREPGSGARQTFDRAMSDLLPSLKVALEFKHNEAIKKAVEAQLGIGCLSRIVLQNNFAAGDLVPLRLPAKRALHRTFYFALPRQHYARQAIDWWMEESRLSQEG